jgi:hypothetical protein
MQIPTVLVVVIEKRPRDREVGKSRRVIDCRASPSTQRLNPEAYPFSGHVYYLYSFSDNGKHAVARVSDSGWQ